MRQIWEQGVGGSNPLAPTNVTNGFRRFIFPEIQLIHISFTKTFTF